MSISSLLVANRGEIAVRLLRAAAEAGIRAVAVYSEDDARSLHVRRADEARALRGAGPRRISTPSRSSRSRATRAATRSTPATGFSPRTPRSRGAAPRRGSCSSGRARRRSSSTATRRGRARRRASSGVPVLDGIDAAVTVEQARAFLRSLGEGAAMAIKAIAGGGGRGMRIVGRVEEVDEAYARCRSEAAAAFGNGDLYVERVIRRARHVEVQIVGDGSGAVRHLGERDCTLQRRHQKLIECAPAPGLDPALRERLLDDAVRMAQAARFSSLGTFEFLIDLDAGEGARRARRAGYAFIEANPRLQVEHTVTEEVTGVDLVLAQLAIAGGASLEQAGLGASVQAEPRGHAIQARVNMETMGADGSARPSGGTLTAFEPPSGPGLRTDTFGYAGYRTNPSFDSLLAKLIAHSPSTDFAAAARKTARALREFRIEGVPTNVELLERLLEHPDFAAGRVHTRFVEERMAEILGAGDGSPRLYFESGGARGRGAVSAGAQDRAFAGAKVDPNDPLAVLAHGRSGDRVVESSAGAAGARCRRRGRGPDAGHHRQHRRRRGRPGARRPAALRHERDEDGARDPGAGRRHRAPGGGRRRRHRVRGTRGPVHRRGRSGRRRRSGDGRSGSRRGAPRPAGDPRSPRHDARRGATRRGRAAAQDAPAHGARERRRPLRSRQPDRVRAAGDRGAAAPPHGRGPDRAHAGRRHDRGRRHREPRPVRRGARALRDPVLRLHGARRHAGQDEPREEGPAVRAGAPAAPAGGLLHRGRRRPPRRHRRRRRRRPHHDGVLPVRQAVGLGADRRHQLGTVLRRQRGAARHLRRHHRDRRTRRSAWAGRR